MSILFASDLPSPESFKALRDSADWGDISLQEAKAVLNSSLGGVSAHQERELIAMARFVGDGVLNIYIQDVVVTKACRGNGIGRELISRVRCSIAERKTSHLVAPMAVMEEKAVMSGLWPTKI